MSAAVARAFARVRTRRTMTVTMTMGATLRRRLGLHNRFTR